MWRGLKSQVHSDEKSSASEIGRLALVVLLVAFAMVACQLASWARNRSDPVQTAASIPAGTVIPTRLAKTFSINGAQPGQAIEAKVAQDVPLPGGEKIAARATVNGSVVSVQDDQTDPGVKLHLKFNQLEEDKQTLTITAYLRAIASPIAVRSAQISSSGSDIGTPSGWADTVLIGGDVRYGDGGVVRNHAKEKVGKGVVGGVLVHVRANPGRGCEGPVNGNDYPQALWVFSSDACGVYDLKGVKVARFGKGSPIGEIVLHFDKDNMKLEAGTGILLRIASQ
ncbi:MAG: hypothetical protein WBR26_02245 [Candidatus Acidiferrum sp.]